MTKGFVSAGTTIPDGFLLQCPKQPMWGDVLAVVECEDCAYFQGVQQVMDETIPDNAPWEVKHRIVCAAPIPRSGRVIKTKKG